MKAVTPLLLKLGVDSGEISRVNMVRWQERATINTPVPSAEPHAAQRYPQEGRPHVSPKRKLLARKEGWERPFHARL